MEDSPAETEQEQAIVLWEAKTLFYELTKLFMESDFAIAGNDLDMQHIPIIAGFDSNGREMFVYQRLVRMSDAQASEPTFFVAYSDDEGGHIAASQESRTGECFGGDEVGHLIDLEYILDIQGRLEGFLPDRDLTEAYRAQLSEMIADAQI